MANISAIKLPDGVTYNIKDNSSGYITGMTILSYGSSTWDDFITAYNANKVVYCRASSNSNPASGSQTRLAFMAYVNNATTPTNVEFQYYRSVSSHTASQQGDQVYVYKLDKTSGWSVTTREASVKVVAGTGLGGTYSNGTMTLTGPTKVSDLTNDSGFITGYTETDPVFSASAAHGIASSDITNWNNKQATLVSGTNIKTVNNESILGSGNIDIQGGGAFIVYPGTTTYTEITDALSAGLAVICEYDDASISGNHYYLPLLYNDVDSSKFVFGGIDENTLNYYTIFVDDGDVWSDGTINLVSTDVATTSANGLMSSTDKSKLDGIASGAEVNVQSDWNEADSTDDAYIKNKPTIPAKNIWYATCSTSASTSAKIATTDSQDFVLETGNMVRVEFDNENTFAATSTLNVDGTGAKYIFSRASSSVSQYHWRDGEVVDFVYDGSYFVMSNKGIAGTTFYGITKLSSSTSSTSESLAATSSAVKAAYDEATDATATPTADKKSKFDSNAHMNSTDMTEQALETYVDSLDIQGSVFVDATDVPTAGEIAKFDSTANMSSTDMTTGSGSELEEFIDGLNISGYDIVEEIPISVSRNTGSGGTVKAYKCGRVVKIEISSATNSSSISAGANMYQATVTGLPNLHIVSGITFYGSSCVIFQIDSYNGTGTLTGRVISSSLPANSPVSTSIVSLWI